MFQNTDMQEANIVEMARVMLFTCRGEKKPIEVRHLEVSNISEATVTMKTVPFREIGPCFDLTLRREKMASTDLYKTACKKPRVRNPDKKRADKNKFTNALGETKGKVFVQHADLDTIALRKFKGMGKKANRKAEKEQEDNQTENVAVAANSTAKQTGVSKKQSKIRLAAEDV